MKFLLSAIFLFISVNCFAELDTFYNAPPKTGKYFLDIPEKGIYVSFIDIFSEGKPDGCYIEINSDKSGSYLLSYSENFPLTLDGHCFELANFRYGMFEIKDNVLPYLNRAFLQKVIYLLYRTGFRPRVTDAMRSPEKQIRYKRRGWSSVGASPHLLGLAVDMVMYSGADRELIKKFAEELGLKYLYHGAGANRHVHLQDEKLWVDFLEKDISYISDSLNTRIKTGSDKRDLRKIDTISTGQKFNYNFMSQRYSRIIFKVEDIYGVRTANINTGIFEPGEHSVRINFDYLPKGFYKINVYENEIFTSQKYFVKY